MANLWQRAKRIFKAKRQETTVADKSKKVVLDRKIYFLDTTALVYYSGKLYGCFLVDQFDPQYLIPGENNIFVTDELTLQEISAMETSSKNEIYFGFTEFIKRNFRVISKEEYSKAMKKENYTRNGWNSKLFISEEESSVHTMESLLYLHNCENLNPILVTDNDKVEIAARNMGFEIYDMI